MTAEKTRIELDRIIDRLYRKGYKGEWIKVVIADLIWYAAGKNSRFKNYKEVLDFVYDLL
jgi:hypothetical protein